MAGEYGHPHVPRPVSAVSALLAVAVLVVGCGSDDRDDDPLGGTPEDATATTTSTSVAASTTTPSDDQVLVELSTSGGLDGRGIGSLVVTIDGVMRHIGDDDRVEQDALAPDELDALVVLLESTDFADLPASPDGAACADAYVYTVHYAGWTVSADDCTIPDPLAPVLDRLQDLLARFDRPS